MSVEFKVILVPTDFSQDADRAVAVGLSMCRASGAKLVMVHAIEPINYPPYYGYAAVPPDETFAAAEKHFDELIEELPTEKRESVEIARVVRVGKPFTVINDAAAEFEADVIVIASHGRGAFERMLLGSTAEKVVRKAPCSCFVVKNPARKVTVTGE